MKKILSILLIASTVTLFSCKKTSTTAVSLTGFWEGTYTDSRSHYFGIVFKADGSALIQLELRDDGTIPPIFFIGTATGSYTNIGGAISMNFTPKGGNKIDLVGNFSTTSNIIKGTFGDDPSTTDDATFTITKAQ